MIVSQKTKTYIIELFNDFIEFRIIIVKPYLKKSNTFIQDSIQDSIQDPIQDFIQNPIQSAKDFVQSKDITLRHNSSRPRQRLIRFQNMIDITIYMFKFISPPINFQTSRLKKLNKLFEKRVFEIIHIDNLFTKTRVFENRFIN